ncbi:MAG: RNA 2',3'-cyclic phosphodiesterase [Candidatus Coatesbacteria bacterium]|nr:RNA 2',3'-cyclic phosphodiesterase [Candidatus Coatesbacteria bacterium]
MTEVLPRESNKLSGIRCFISIEIPQAIRKQIVQVPEALKSVKGKFSWSGTNNLHITLKFLGDCSRGRLEAISRRLAGIAAHHAPFDLSFEEVGVFPGHSSPRIVWLGVKDGRDVLVKLASDVADSMEEIGFKKEPRPFRPHITLARVKYLSSRDELRAAIERMPNANIERMRASHIFLMRSQLNPKGAIYTVIERLCFSGQGNASEVTPDGQVL